MRKFFICLGATLSLVCDLVGFDRLYVGGSAGANGTIVRQDGNMLAQYLSGTGVDFFSFPVDLTADFFDSNAEGSLFAGYGRTWRCFYAGLEGFVRYSHPKFTIHRGRLLNEPPTVFFDPENNSQVTIGPWHYGLDARVGFFLTPITLFYGRIGVEWAKIKLTSDDSFTGLSNGDVLNVSFSPFRRKHDPFLRVGAGIEQSLNSRLSLKIDYLYTDYRDISVHDQKIAPTTSGNIVTLSDDSKVHLKNHAVTLGLSYYFSQNSPCNFEYDCLDPCFSGFYLAGALGGSIFDGKASGEPNGHIMGGSLIPFTTYVSPSPRLSDLNFLGLVSGGYGCQWHCIYLGLEAFAHYSHQFRSLEASHVVDAAEVLFTSVSFKTRAEIDPWQFGINFRPGLKITPTTLVFGAIGTSYARLEAHSKGLGTFPVATETVELLSSKKANRATLRVGGGIEYALSSCWHLRADYMYTDYGTLRLSGFNQTTTTPPFTLQITEDTHIHLRTHDVTLGIVRYF
jgi:opacity protein-like surface antigen